MKVTGYYSLEDRLLTSDGIQITKPPYLGWLIEQKGDYHVCYHLDHFVACLGKLIQLEKWEVKKLVDTGKLKTGAFYLDYVPGKFFSIKQGTGYGRPYILLSDSSKFIECTFTKDVKEGFGRAEQARQVGEEIAEALVSLGLNPSTLVSPIRAWEKERMAELELPTLDDMPEQVGEWAYEACKGNWVEAFSRGHWDKAWDWDINSAYPYFAMNLPSFSINDWTKDYDGDPRANIGIYRCLVEMTASFHPVIYRRKGKRDDEDRNYTPVGKWEEHLNLKMIRHIEKYNLGKVRILEGWCLKYTTNNRIKPLAKAMTELYKEKDKENGIRREVVKRIMSGIYGKMLEVRMFTEEPFGPYFNPVWAMEIETGTRIEVHRFCMENRVVPLHVAVDGVLVDRELKEKSNGGMGKWRQASYCPAVVIGSGQVALRDKKGVGDFSLDYDWLMEHGVEKLEKLSPITLAKSLNLSRTEDIGKLEIASKQIDLNSESKRGYKSSIKDWEDLISKQDESMPFDVATVANKEDLI